MRAMKIHRFAIWRWKSSTQRHVRKEKGPNERMRQSLEQKTEPSFEQIPIRWSRAEKY